MKIKIELMPEQIQAIVVEELKLQYAEMLDSDPHLEEDRRYQKKMKKALQRVLEYNMTPYESAEYFYGEQYND